MEAGSHGLGGSGLFQAGLVGPGKSPPSSAPHVTSRPSSHQHWPSYRLESTGSWEGLWHFLTRTTDTGHLEKVACLGPRQPGPRPAVPPFEAVLPTLSCCGRSPACLYLTPPHTPRAHGLQIQIHLRSCLQKNIIRRVHLPLKHCNSHRQHQSQTERDRGDPLPSGDVMSERWLRFSGQASWGRRLNTGLRKAHQL